VSTDFDKDPISLEIAWGRLQSIVDEAAAGLIRTAFSSIIREGKDFTVMLLDRSGHSIVQSTQSIPAFIGTMPRTMGAMLEKFPVDQWQPGDVVGTNDPWLGAGHLPDVNIAQPVFHDGRLVAFAGVIAHMADIGGRGFASDAREVYEEGLRIPICRFRRGGEVNRDLYDIIADNVRLPRQVLGDIEAMIAVGFQIEERLRRLLEELRLDGVGNLGRAIQDRSEKAMRQAISQVPPGTYRDAVPVDGLGQDLRIAAAVTFRGSEITVDFDGSSPQIQGGINSTFGYSYSYTAYALKCLLSPSIPINDGTFRPIGMTAPEGTIINSRPPAAVAARSQVGHYISSAIYGALAPIVPEKVIADSGSPRPMVIMSGRTDAGDAFVTTVLVHGGMGATPRNDGLPCIAFPTNTAGIPVEIVEATTPVLVEEKEFIADSGGEGQFRGGLGQRIVLRMLSDHPTRVSILAQRDRFAPRGLFGGGPGRKLYGSLNDGQPVDVHGVTILKKDDRLVIDAPGGGGFGPPEARSAVAAASDAKNGVVSSLAPAAPSRRKKGRSTVSS
jgi:N-methylhydantoinase B